MSVFVRLFCMLPAKINIYSDLQVEKALLIFRFGSKEDRMGNQLVWQDRYNIGVELIDREHRKLFGVINKLLEFRNQDGKSQWVCQEGIKYFKEHAMKHFSEEEVYMASISYKEFDIHRRLHDNFRKKTLPALEKELERTDYSEDAVNHFLGVCAGWLIAHTLTEDRAITGKAMSKWQNLRPEEEQTVMRKLVGQLLSDLFQMEAKVISDNYSGEKFGQGIYYRLIYSNEKKERREYILVFEEKLLIRTTGKLLGGHFTQMNDLLMNTSRYVAKQFVERIREHMSEAGVFELQDENLLSYEQFQRVFEERPPHYSMLFGTEEGYFAFCIASFSKDQSRVAVSIKEENALEEVAKYVKENHQSNISDQRKQILIVDDSDTMLYAMKNLFSTDYQVTLAKSGTAAIRCITLNRPDLVLLDYEMPVCDGAQVLEMIRSEPEFATVPVYFLTSRVDRESVDKVIPLRPSGYLLKSMPPEEIKKNVDAFFKK